MFGCGSGSRSGRTTGQGSLAVLNILKRVAQLILNLIYMKANANAAHTTVYTHTFIHSYMYVFVCLCVCVLGQAFVGSMCHAPYLSSSSPLSSCCLLSGFRNGVVIIWNCRMLLSKVFRLILGQFLARVYYINHQVMTVQDFKPKI